MTPEAQRIAIAEACGWKLAQNRDHTMKWIGPDGSYLHPWLHSSDEALKRVPNYLADLNAMHEAEHALCSRMDYWLRYSDKLERIAGQCYWHATAAQRAEAFLRTLNLWNETTP